MPPASPKTSPVIKRKAPKPPVAAVRKSTLQSTPVSRGVGTSSPSCKPPFHYQFTDYIASYDFCGTEQGDLSFVAGDVIEVTSRDGEWWKGELRGVSGIFPANYVTLHQKVDSNEVGWLP